MHRAPLLQLLEDYSVRYPDESDCVNRYRSFVQSHSDCFERSLEIGHITGAAWLVDATGTKVLLTHHAKLDKWLQLGGHADGNSDVLQVATDEAHEESGLENIIPLSKEIFDLDIHTIPARKADPEHLHYDARFAFQHTGSGEFVVSPESIDLAWIDIAKLGEVTQEHSILRMAEKWMRAKSDIF